MKPLTLNKITYLIAIIVLSNRICAQDLEPRILSAVPVGVNFAVASYGYSSGDVIADSNLPIENLNAKLNNTVFGYLHSFNLFKKLTKVDVVLPISFAKFNADVDQLDTSVNRNGLGDASVRLAMILIGNKPLTPKQFFERQRSKFNLGAQIKVKLPVGKYDETKLLNLGSNRWSTKLGIASSYSITDKIIIEGQLNTWFFTENKSFYNGNSLKQNPLVSAQFHLTYLFKPSTWFALSVGKSKFGETILNNIEKDDNQNNSRYGIVIAHKINNKSALKFAFTSGVSTRYGTNFTTVLIAYQFMWMRNH